VYQSSNGRTTAYSYNGDQLTSSLLSHGDWDDDFLKDFGTELVQKEQDRYQFWGTDRESSWNGDGTWDLINSDPMVGFSDGLGHNPEAATDFLSGSTETDDGTIDNLDYLLKDREWHGGDADKAHFGHALHAATTGHAYDDAPSGLMPPHTRAQADIMKDVITTVGNQPDVAGDGMKDSLGKMGAEYTADLNRGLITDEYMKEHGMPVAGAKIDLERNEVTSFIYEVSSDPEGHAAMSIGQQRYTGDLIEYHTQNPDAFDASFKTKISQVAEASGMADGISARARCDEVIREGAQRDEDFNSALETGGKWVQGAISVGATAGGAPGAAAGEAGKLIVDEIVNSAKQDNSDEYGGNASSKLESMRGEAYENIWTGLRGAGVEPPGDMKTGDFHGLISGGFDSGWDDAGQHVRDYVENKRE
ncbi:DUF6571 family protein, partial [Streptomyces sp. TR06-5]|uniref:DUF6571 family protein n=1 Tax=Streptomyces sp. TR06-5 TaxID=3385976 RepID=UPI0039A038BE